MVSRIRIAFDLHSLENALEKGFQGQAKDHADPKAAAHQWAAAIRHVLETREDPTEWVKASLQVRKTEKEGWRHFPYEVQVESHYMLPAREVLEKAGRSAKVDPAVVKWSEKDTHVLDEIAKLHGAAFADDVRSPTAWQEEIDNGDLDKTLDDHTVGLETGPEGWRVEGVDQPRVTSSASSDGTVTTVLRAILHLQDPPFETDEDNPRHYRDAAGPPHLRLVRDEEEGPRMNPTPRKEPSDEDRAAQALFDREVVGRTGEGEKLRWHAYRGNIEVTELAGAGKPGKRPRRVRLFLPDRALPKAAYVELAKFLRLMLSEHAHYEGAVHWFKKFYDTYGTQVYGWRDPIEETVVRGVDVDPKSSRFKAHFNEERGEVTVSPTSILFSWRSGINDLKGGPNTGRETQKVYQWILGNRDRMKDLTWPELWGAIHRETGVAMNHH